MTDPSRQPKTTGRPNVRLRNIRWSLLNANERLEAEQRRVGGYPLARRLLLAPTFWALRAGLAMVTNLLSLPIYVTRNTPTRFAAYARQRQDTYVDSYTRFQSNARWTIGFFLVTVVAVVSAMTLAALLRDRVAPRPDSQQIFHVGILKRSDALDPLIISFQRNLAERGYRAGERVIYDQQTISGSPAEMETVAAAFVGQKSDLILAVGDIAAQAVKKATLQINIPTVFYANFDPVEDGLIKNYGRSESNFVGVGEGALVKQQVELLKKIAPTVRTLGVMSVPADGTNQRFIRALQAAVVGEKIAVQTETITAIEDIPAALDALVVAGARSVYLAPSALTAPHLELIARASLARNIILIGNSAKNAEAGALFALMADLDVIGQQLASQADQIFRDISPSNISSQFPSKSLLALNRKTAAALGLTIPADIIERADVRY